MIQLSNKDQFHDLVSWTNDSGEEQELTVIIFWSQNKTDIQKACLSYFILKLV